MQISAHINSFSNLLLLSFQVAIKQISRDRIQQWAKVVSKSFI